MLSSAVSVPHVRVTERRRKTLLLQLIYSFFASAAARGLCTSAMLEAGVLKAMRDDPVLGLVRQASTGKQASKTVVVRLFTSVVFPPGADVIVNLLI